MSQSVTTTATEATMSTPTRTFAKTNTVTRNGQAAGTFSWVQGKVAGVVDAGHWVCADTDGVALAAIQMDMDTYRYAVVSPFIEAGTQVQGLENAVKTVFGQAAEIV